MIRKIVHIGNPALRQIADEVKRDEIKSVEIQNLIDDLIETMRDANGAGLASTQKIGRAHVRTPVTEKSRMPSSA